MAIYTSNYIAFNEKGKGWLEMEKFNTDYKQWGLPRGECDKQHEPWKPVTQDFFISDTWIQIQQSHKKHYKRQCHWPFFPTADIVFSYKGCKCQKPNFASPMNTLALGSPPPPFFKIYMWNKFSKKRKTWHEYTPPWKTSMMNLKNLGQTLQEV